MPNQTTANRLHPSELEEREFKYLDQALLSCKYSEYFFVRLEAVLQLEPRLALYLPMSVLRQAPPFFRESYMRAWRLCTKQVDRRDDFTPQYNKESVIKAAHLLPMLVEAGVMQRASISKEFCKAKRNPLLYHNLAETAPILLMRGYISQEQFERIRQNDAKAVESLEQNPIEAPFYNSMTERIVRRSEKEILQDHLLKEYFPRKYDKLSVSTQGYPTIDGSSAFYDDRYRETASRMLILAISFI